MMSIYGSRKCAAASWSAVAEGQGASLPRRHRCRALKEWFQSFSRRPAHGSGVALRLATALHDAAANSDGARPITSFRRHAQWEVRPRTRLEAEKPGIPGHPYGGPVREDFLINNSCVQFTFLSMIPAMHLEVSIPIERTASHRPGMSGYSVAGKGLPHEQGIHPNSRGMNPSEGGIHPVRKGKHLQLSGNAPQVRGIVPALRGRLTSRLGIHPVRRYLHPVASGMIPFLSGIHPPAQKTHPFSHLRPLPAAKTSTGRPA